MENYIYYIVAFSIILSSIFNYNLYMKKEEIKSNAGFYLTLLFSEVFIKFIILPIALIYYKDYGFLQIISYFFLYYISTVFLVMLIVKYFEIKNNG